MYDFYAYVCFFQSIETQKYDRRFCPDPISMIQINITINKIFFFEFRYIIGNVILSN